MGKRAFLIAGDRAALVANDVTDFRYRAALHHLPVGVQVPARSSQRAETQFMVEDGIVEFMIGGAAGMALAGDFVRVPPGVPFACRNAGDTTAVLLVRTTSPKTMRRAIRVGFEFAA
ncbi:MAG: cupin domain-containing protein [Devosia sp.]|nr:cupin domain-containing protein [Devosia sp.]